MTGRGDAGKPTIYTIAARFAFTDALAAGLLARFGDEPLALSRATILVPTRRATRALRDAFMRAGMRAGMRTGDGRSMLLPTIRAIGDIDEEEMILANTGISADLDIDPPPAIEPLRRQLLLTRLISRLPATADDPSRRDVAQAAALAQELARLIDQVQTEGLSFDRLVDLAPATYAAHWQKILDFLAIVSEYWPAILDDHGLLDAATRRNRLLEHQTGIWRRNPPREAIIAAGSTGSIPATARLLGTIARLPQGAVILPGLDLEMDAASWRALDPTHSQFGMKQLLDRISASRDDVREWPLVAKGSPVAASHPARSALISEALRPAATTDAWRRIETTDPMAVAGLERIDVPTPREEAGVIALMMRRALETAGRTAALVTPDRKLGRRVAAELRRWNIEIDDSAGEPLAETPPGTFMRLLANMIGDKAAPATLLSFLKHPLATGMGGREICLSMTRRLEIKLLRGPRPAPGLDGLLRALRANGGSNDGDLDDWLSGLAAMVEPFSTSMDRGEVSLATLVHHHVAVAEQLAASDAPTGDSQLWAGEAGRVAARFFAELAEAADCLPEMAGRSYPALLDRLMTGHVVRPRHGLHPRLNIWGPLEARLQRADLLILGSLNEGSWPADAGADPWLSRPMRAEFGLPSPERRIGLAAHDFAQAVNAPRVVMTRAEKVDGTPTVPSRWLQRLHNLLDQSLTPAEPWLDWLAELDRPAAIHPVAPPRPRPPVAARPRTLSVTQVETWMRDPYALYARHILNLKPLDPMDADPGAAEHGTFIHQALDSFIRAYPDHLPADALQRLIQHGHDAFGEALQRPSVWSFWWPRFCRIAAWFVDHERARRPDARPVATEVSGEIPLDLPGGTFRLRAKADRIDRLAAGGLAIIDYKTGGTPTVKQIKAGFAPQLPLEALLAAEGGFEGIAAQPVAELAFWRLRGQDPVAEIKPVNLDIGELAQEAREGLIRLAAEFERPETPYLSVPRPAHAGYGEYDHLARVKEWSTPAGQDE
ncbi:MAG: double-strand break repair protein AddB [Sphingomonadales bacterium]